MENREHLKSGETEPSPRSDFSYPGYDEWKAAAERLLKGKDFDRTLKTGTPEGITLDPVYNQEDIEGLNIDSLPGCENFLRGQKKGGHLGRGWNICQRMPSGNPKDLNRELTAALAAGQNAVMLTPGSPSLKGVEELKEALKNIDLSEYPVVMDTHCSDTNLYTLLKGVGDNEALDPGALKGDLNVDPLAVLVTDGELNSKPEFHYEQMAGLIRQIRQDRSSVKAIGVSVLPYHNAGASATQETAIALATAVEYMEALKMNGISPREAAPSISFRFGIGSDFFMEIAKLRAGRVLWNRIQEAYGIPEGERSFHVHSETSLFNQSALDPYVNMLRVTTEAFSAIAGGADNLTTHPFDRVLGEDDEFSRRVARNVQILLKEESQLYRVIDPAGGSYFVEKLTSQLVQEIWRLFLAIEDGGGVQKGLESGWIQEIIKGGRSELDKVFARRKKVMVGVNNYGNPEEDVAGMRNREPEMIEKRGEPALKIEKLNMSRLSTMMENLRGKVDRAKALFPDFRSITIAVNEPFLKIKPRGDFSKAFFETGGFGTRTVRAEGTIEDKADKIAAEGNRVIVLCAGDKDYPDLVPAMIEAVKKRIEAPVFVLAGDPGDQREHFLNLGIHLFIYRGVDLPEIILKVLEKAGASNG